MATDANPMDTVVTLLTDNYNISNADDITPIIAKIYTKPTDKEPKENQDFIYIYSGTSLFNSVGMGNNTVSEVTEPIKIDIRVRPDNSKQTTKINDAHARKVLTEVKRVLFANITSPGTPFDNIDPSTITHIDLSNGMRGIFRYVISIELKDLCRDMTA